MAGEPKSSLCSFLLVAVILLLSSPSLRSVAATDVVVGGLRGGGYYYADNGPYEVLPVEQHSIRMNATLTECAPGFADFCNVHVDIYRPLTLESGHTNGQDKANLGSDVFPLAIFSTAFMIDTDSYTSYAMRLASWGYIVAVWAPDRELRGFHCTFRSRGLIAAGLIDWVLETVEPDSYTNAQVFMMGHSDGAKSAMLAAEYDSRVVGVLGLDPIDCPPPAQSEGYDYPSAIKLMNTSSALTAWIGSEYGSMRQLRGRGGGGVEVRVMIRRSGTMQFCDHGNPTDIVCVNGDVTRETVWSVAHTVMVAWAECTVRRVNIVDKYLGQWSEEMIATKVITAESRVEQIKSHILMN
ncbi:hypothetical protein CBR_g38260 [Chara braunii]|uniref:Chlorophyllase n=1 Tax=Chara braunii TaxID=69332 RepID=A0A388LPM4_CHABU|nr:hypothetical protein CBR_g38260 [Chara braunii]|eukprot:GBG84290.1 hypothetical protein CBR_g38260 [Chara braunii]